MIIWLKVAKQDALTKSVPVSLCIAVAVLSLLCGYVNGLGIFLLIPAALSALSIFGPDNSKFVGAADLLIPVHFISCYVLPFNYEHLVFSLTTFLNAISIYIWFHKKLTGIRWKPGVITAGLPPYAIFVAIMTVCDVVEVLFKIFA